MLRVACSSIDGKVFMLSMLSIHRGTQLDSVENVEAEEELDSNVGPQILRLSASRR